MKQTSAMAVSDMLPARLSWNLDVHPLVSFLLCLLALYAAIGLVAALAFVAFGVTRVQPAPMSLGARILILPGAAALWPYLMLRWWKAAS